MKKYDVIIIGGGPAGIITGVSAKKTYKNKSILMIKEEAKGLVPCGIPYIFHDLNSVEKNEMGPKAFVGLGGDVLVDKVTKIFKTEKSLQTESGKEFEFDKLIFATGSTPIVPTFIKGYDLDGVHYIKKSHQYISQLKPLTDKAKNIVVVGGGFIGVELAEQLAKFQDKTVSLIEMGEYCLGRAFSKNVAGKANDAIQESNIQLFTRSKVEQLTGKDGVVQSVELSNGTRIDADLVIFSIGYKPNTELAKECGFQVNSNNAIICDQYMRTPTKNFYAVGDCAQTTSFITGEVDNIMLASTATSEARILGYNLFKLNIVRDFLGTLSVFSTEINGKVFASAGAIEDRVKNENVSYVVGEFQDVDRHPGTIEDTSPLYAKLIVSPQSGIIIGGELCGGKSVGELINVISLAIQKQVTIYELISFQMGTHPLLTPAPTKYILIKAAENALSKISM
jgi:NADPH-dependent 2,4-dienoyl-CoA reductase/sulfur reductase-like enzyme